MELHARPLLLRKHPYHGLGVTKETVGELCQGLSGLVSDGLMRVDAWAVVKRGPDARPLADTLIPALALSNGQARVVFSDVGRIGVMRGLHRHAMITGAVDGGVVESIHGIGSVHSDFVQIADVFATAAYLRLASELAMPMHARMRREEVGLLVDMLSGPNRKLHLVRA